MQLVDPLRRVGGGVAAVCQQQGGDLAQAWVILQGLQQGRKASPRQRPNSRPMTAANSSERIAMLNPC